jgi:tetratricopeptide (TPR) repeat protein
MESQCEAFFRRGEHRESLYQTEHPAVFEEINETAKKYNAALSYAKQGSDDLAMIQVKKVLSVTPNFVNAHLLFALLHMRAGDNASAQADLNNALAIDRYNTTARRYLKEIGENPETVAEKIPADALKPDNENLKNVRPVDHYEDPNKETWKQFVYMLIGLAIGVVAMFVLVIPSVKASVSVDYNNLKKEYSQTTNKKDAEINTLKDDKKSLQKKNKKLTKRLKVYEGSKGEDSMYDSILKASQAYSSGNYVECAKHLLKVDKSSLPSSTAKNLYTSMKDKAFQNAATQLYNSGKASFDAYKYQDALDDLEQSYKYDKSYNTEYHIAMCYKNLNKNTDKAKEYFYDIINNSGDSDLIRKAANLGLDMVINSAKEAAAKAKGGSTKSSDSKSDSDDDSTDSSESKKSSSKSTTEEDFSTDTADDNE